MAQGLLHTDMLQLLPCIITKASTACRNDQLIDSTMLIALEALKDCGMLRINRIQLRRMLCKLLLYKLTADHKAFLVR